MISIYKLPSKPTNPTSHAQGYHSASEHRQISSTVPEALRSLSANHIATTSRCNASINSMHPSQILKTGLYTILALGIAAHCLPHRTSTGVYPYPGNSTAPPSSTTTTITVPPHTTYSHPHNKWNMHGLFNITVLLFFYDVLSFFVFLGRFMVWRTL